MKLNLTMIDELWISLSLYVLRIYQYNYKAWRFKWQN